MWVFVFWLLFAKVISCSRLCWCLSSGLCGCLSSGSGLSRCSCLCWCLCFVLVLVGVCVGVLVLSS